MNSNSGFGGVGQAVGLSMAPRTAGGANSKEVAAGGFWERGFGNGGHDFPARGLGLGRVWGSPSVPSSDPIADLWAGSAGSPGAAGDSPGADGLAFLPDHSCGGKAAPCGAHSCSFLCFSFFKYFFFFFFSGRIHGI